MKTKLIILPSLLVILSACSKEGSSQSPNQNPGKSGESCSLEGQWSRCGANGSSSSSRVSLNVTNGVLHEVIEQFNNVADCSGANDGEFVINATLTLGAIGQSTFISGGTDVDLVPDMDFAGCGAGQPVYTVLKFNDSCTEFQSTVTAPACSPAGRGTSLDPAPFLKQ